MLTIGMNQSLGKSCRLDIQYLLTGFRHLFIAWNKGMCIDKPLQFKITITHRFGGYQLTVGITLGVDKRRVGMALCTQALHVNLC